MKRWLIVRDRYDLAYFTGAELAAADEFKLQKRRDEWLLARFAAKKLALELGVASDPRAISVGRPTLLVEGAPSSWFVSISHSAPYAAAAIDRTPVGIDVQVVRELPERGAHLFLSEEETSAMQRCAIGDRILHFWCAKEAAWKQRSNEFATLRALPLQLRTERAEGLLFDLSETRRLEDLILALTLPTS